MITSRHDFSERHLPRYRRVADPPPMRLTERDKRILEAIHHYEGVLADFQIQRLFFTSRTQASFRLKLLYQNAYVSRPDRKQRAALPAMVYWLDRAGAAYVAALQGQSLESFSYRKEPRYLQLEHDLQVNDVRITLEEACSRTPGFVLDEWIPGTEFAAYPDKVTYSYAGKEVTRYVRPDSFCVITRTESDGEYSSRLLLELDRAREDNPRIVREKILPGIAYLRSAAYKQRFGYNTGRILFVTTSDRRARNMKRKAEAAAGKDASIFYFTTFDQVTSEGVLLQPIWYRGGWDSPTTLFKP